MRTGLDHLPAAKRRELEQVTQILFGSYARGDWIEDRGSGYISDYDLLVIVNFEAFTDLQSWWGAADDHLVRALTVTHQLATPVNFIVHSLRDLNGQLGRGQPFFTDIIRDGIALYEAADHPLATPKPLSPDDRRVEGERHFGHWLPKASRRLHLAQFAIEQGYASEAAFELHQAVEHLYHCALLVLSLYSPKSHRLTVLRSLAENLDPRLIAAWPRDTRFARRAFARLGRAYVDGRYSPEYEITGEELAWLVERVRTLHAIVASVGAEHLAGKGET